MTPHAGPNTTPADSKSNFWRKYEFPTLERNNAIRPLKLSMLLSMIGKLDGYQMIRIT